MKKEKIVVRYHDFKKIEIPSNRQQFDAAYLADVLGEVFPDAEAWGFYRELPSGAMFFVLRSKDEFIVVNYRDKTYLVSDEMKKPEAPENKSVKGKKLSDDELDELYTQREFEANEYKAKKASLASSGMVLEYVPNIYILRRGVPHAHINVRDFKKN